MSALTPVQDALVVAKRNLIKIKRVPDLLVFTTLSPIMFVLLFAYVFGGAIDRSGGGSAYREFLIAGIFAQTVVFGATITGAGLAEDVKKGIVDRFRTLPISRRRCSSGAACRASSTAASGSSSCRSPACSSAGASTAACRRPSSRSRCSCSSASR